MKKFSKFIFVVSLTYAFCLSAFSQDKAPISIDNTNIIHSVTSQNQNQDGIQPPSTQAFSTVIVGNTFSNNAQAPQGSRLFNNCKYLVTASEMFASGFTGPVTSIGWRWNVAGGGLSSQTVNTTGNLRVYMKDTVFNAVSVGGTFIDTNGTGYIKVIDGIISIPAGITEINVDVPAGGPGTGTYTHIPGRGVLVIYVYKTTTTLSGLFMGVFPPTVWGTNFNGTSLTYQSTTSPGAVGTFSSFRPETRFGNTLIHIAEFSNIYALGKKAHPWNSPDTLCVRVKKFLSDTNQIRIRITVVNLPPYGTDVKLDTIIYININNPFDITLYRQLPFKNYRSRFLISANILPIPGETDTSKHTISYCQDNTCDAMNHTDPCLPEDGAVAFGNIGQRVSCFPNLSPQPLPICAVDLCFIGTPTYQGNQKYNVIIYGDGGTGPGALLYRSDYLRTPFGTGTKRVTHFPPTPIPIPPNSKFYVGVAQDSAGLFVCYQTENPPKPRAYYFKFDTLFGSGTWTDARNSIGANWRLDIGARTSLQLNLGVYLQGFYNGGPMIPDTVKLNVHSQTAPYQLVDSSKAVVDSNGLGLFDFCRLSSDSCYYFVAKHRNHIETWSHSQCEKFDSCNKGYDFRFDITKAFGNNMIQLGPTFALYGGDVNQDGIVEGADLSLIDNDAANFVTGYVATDVDGNDFVDGNDALYCENNSFNFVTCIGP